MSKTSSSASFQSGPYSVPSLNIPAFQRLRIELWSAQAYPAPACGLLYGHADGDSTCVVQARRALSAGGSEVAPAEHRAGESEAAKLGLDVVGTWHSRPDEAAVPTPDDRARSWSGWSHVLVGIDRRAEREVRSWRREGDHFVEEEVRS